MNKIITALLILLVLSFNQISAQNTSPDNLVVPLSNPGKAILTEGRSGKRLDYGEQLCR